MTFRPSLNISRLRTSQTVAISAEASRRKAAGENIIDLGLGEPDFDTPKLAAEAGINAIREGKTHYPPNVGIAELRRAMAGALSRLSGNRPIDPDNLIISNGSKQAIFNACFALFGPGDKVLIPTPAWVSYPQIVELARAEAVSVPGDPEWGLKVSVADLERHRDAATHGLILCSPSNPTGAVYTLAELRSIAEWAKQHGIWVIADEIYREIHYGVGPAPSFFQLEDALLTRVVVIYGASKAYAMTGWRIGAAWAESDLIKAMAALQSHTTTGANQPAMWAAAEAFGNPAVHEEVVSMVAAFRRRRDYLVARFRDQLPGVEFIEPHGAFYLFFRVDGIAPRLAMTGMTFCRQLMQEEGVSLVPGGTFGDDRWVRLAYSVSEAELEEGCDRLVRFIHKLPTEALTDAPA